MLDVHKAVNDPQLWKVRLVGKEKWLLAVPARATLVSHCSNNLLKAAPGYAAVLWVLIRAPPSLWWFKHLPQEVMIIFAIFTQREHHRRREGDAQVRVLTQLCPKEIRWDRLELAGAEIVPLRFR